MPNNIRIVFSVVSLAIYLEVDPIVVLRWTNEKIIPKMDRRPPPEYDKKEIDAWLATGEIKRLHKGVETKKRGMYGV